MSQFSTISDIVLDISSCPQPERCMYTLCGYCIQLFGSAKIIVRLAILSQSPEHCRNASVLSSVPVTVWMQSSLGILRTRGGELETNPEIK